MQYEKFKNIFNETIFEESKAVLIEKIAKYPNRYIGLFRPTKPKAKILQNLLQSHEIRFGDAFEEAIEEYFKEFGYQILEKKFVNGDNDELNLDQCFKFKDKVYFIEQKIAGVIVLYNPNEEVIDNIRSYLEDIEILYAVDNSETKKDEIIKKIESFNKIVYIDNNGN